MSSRGRGGAAHRLRSRGSTPDPLGGRSLHGSSRGSSQALASQPLPRGRGLRRQLGDGTSSAPVGTPEKGKWSCSRQPQRSASPLPPLARPGARDEAVSPASAGSAVVIASKPFRRRTTHQLAAAEELSERRPEAALAEAHRRGRRATGTRCRARDQGSEEREREPRIQPARRRCTRALDQALEHARQEARRATVPAPKAPPEVAGVSAVPAAGELPRLPVDIARSPPFPNEATQVVTIASRAASFIEISPKRSDQELPHLSDEPAAEADQEVVGLLNSLVEAQPSVGVSKVPSFFMPEAEAPRSFPTAAELERDGVLVDTSEEGVVAAMLRISSGKPNGIPKRISTGIPERIAEEAECSPCSAISAH